VNELLIRFRRDRAKETLADAGMLLPDGSPASALNRIYNAMFYEVLALLHTQDLASAKHSGARALQRALRQDGHRAGGAGASVRAHVRLPAEERLRRLRAD